MARGAWTVLMVGAIGLFACRNDAPRDRVVASGTFEAVEVRISPTVSGQVSDVSIEEGRTLEKDGVVARLDDRHHRNQIAQAEAAVALADAHVRIVRLGARREDVEALRQQVRQAEEALAQARKDRDRARALVEAEGLPRKMLDDAETLVAVREAAYKAARELLAKARTGARPEEIEAAEAQKQQAEAVLKALRDRLDDYTVRSPVTGTVLQKLVEAGEVVAAGQTLATVADLSWLTLRVYVPEGDLGRIRLGQEVLVRVDSYPDREFPGRLAHIASEAEFTPKNIQTREERVKTVYAVKVVVPNPEGVLKVGMPADAEIRFEP